MITTHAKNVTIVVLEIVSAPSASFNAGSVTTFVNDLVSAPKINNAAFSKK